MAQEIIYGNMGEQIEQFATRLIDQAKKTPHQGILGSIDNVVLCVYAHTTVRQLVNAYNRSLPHATGKTKAKINLATPVYPDYEIEDYVWEYLERLIKMAKLENTYIVGFWDGVEVFVNSRTEFEKIFGEYVGYRNYSYKPFSDEHIVESKDDEDLEAFITRLDRLSKEKTYCRGRVLGKFFGDLFGGYDFIIVAFSSKTPGFNLGHTEGQHRAFLDKA